MLARALFIATPVCLLAGCGVTGNFRHDPGFAAFGPLHRLQSESDFSISLGPLPLELARWMLDDDEPELGPLLDELKGIRVYTFEALRHPEEVADEIERVKHDLLAEGWISVITVREHAEVVSVLLRPGERGRNRGLTVIAQEPDELVLVNLIGNVRLDLFADYMAELDVEMPPVEIDAATLQAHSLEARAANARAVGGL